MTSPLLVDCIVEAGNASTNEIFPADSDRSRVSYLQSPSLWKLARRWTRGAIDVAVVTDRSRLKSARTAGGLSGVPVIEAVPGEDPALLERRAAIAAARPGAGLDAEGPVSIVVPVLDEGEALDTLLSNLVDQLEADDEILVVDGGSTDDTAARGRRWSADHAVRVLDRPGTNIPAARNAGVAEARNQTIALTDAGCRPTSGWLAAIKSAFCEIPSPGLVTGVYRVAAHTPWEHAIAVSCYPVPDEAGRAGFLVRAFGRVLGRTFDPTLPTGRSLGLSARAWQAIGGMPEHLDTAEDVTFGRALVADGYECVLSRDAEVVWEQRPTLRGTARMYFRYGVGGGRSRDRLVVGRDVARALAYLLVPYLFFSRSLPTKIGIVSLGLLYISLPLMRARRRPNPVTVAVLTVPAIILKDLAKASGCIASLVGLAGRPTDR